MCARFAASLQELPSDYTTTGELRKACRSPWLAWSDSCQAANKVRLAQSSYQHNSRVIDYYSLLSLTKSNPACLVTKRRGFITAKSNRLCTILCNRFVHAPPQSRRPTKNIRSTTASTAVVPNRSAHSSSPASGPVTATIRVRRNYIRDPLGCVRHGAKISICRLFSRFLHSSSYRCVARIWCIHVSVGLLVWGSPDTKSVSPQTRLCQVTPTRSLNDADHHLRLQINIPAAGKLLTYTPAALHGGFTVVFDASGSSSVPQQQAEACTPH